MLSSCNILLGDEGASKYAKEEFYFDEAVPKAIKTYFYAVI